MSAITAYYLNEMNDKLQGIGDALLAQNVGLSEWKKSTGTIPAEDLDGHTMLVLAIVGAQTGGGQMAMSMIPLQDLKISVGSVSANNTAANCGTVVNILSDFTGATDTTVYPVLTYSEDGGATVSFVKKGNASLGSTFYYTAF